jgi:hypothetical protein
MGQFTIGEAWSQAMAFFNDNMQMLLLWVGAPIIAFGIVEGLFFNVDQAAVQTMTERAMRSGDWMPLLTAMGGVGVGVLGLISAVVQSATQFAATRMGLGHQEEAGSLLSYGLGAAVTTLIVYFLFFAVVIGIPIGLMVAMIGGGVAAGGTTGAAAGVGMALLLLVLLLPLIIWLSVRLSVVVPAMADARSANPLYGFSASWRLTASNQWAILGYVILVSIAALVVFMVVGGIVGVIGAALGQTATAILNATLLTAPVAIFSTALAAGLYRTLAPSQQGAIFS